MAHRPSCGAFALPAQCASPSVSGTSPVRPPARAMRQPIRAQHVAGALPTRTMQQPIRARHVAGASACPHNASAHTRTAHRRCVRLPAQCISPSVPGTSPVRPPARAMRQPAAWSSFHRKTVIPPRRHNITQSHHDSALSQTYNTANSQCHCRHICRLTPPPQRITTSAISAQPDFAQARFDAIASRFSPVPCRLDASRPPSAWYGLPE